MHNPPTDAASPCRGTVSVNAIAISQRRNLSGIAGDSKPEGRSSGRTARAARKPADWSWLLLSVIRRRYVYVDARRSRDDFLQIHNLLEPVEIPGRRLSIHLQVHR